MFDRYWKWHVGEGMHGKIQHSFN